MKFLNWVMLSLFIFILPVNLWASQPSGSNLQIIEAQGSFDIFTLGSYIQGHACLEQIGKNIYKSGSTPAVVFTDEAGQIQEIAVTGPGIFTQRYVTIGQSTMMDVLKRYGQAHFDFLVIEHSIVLSYGNLVFFFDDAAYYGKSDQLSQTVKLITLMRGGPDLPPTSAPRVIRHPTTSPQTIIFSNILKVVSQPHAQCDVTLWNRVYHSYRLIVIQQCTCVTGTILDATNGMQSDGVRRERDGDAHGWLKVDSEFQNLLNEGNMTGQNGNLVFEIVCRFPVTQADAKAGCQGYLDHIALPPVGSHVRIVGTYVQDTFHGQWMEIHPVTSITTVP